MASLNGFSSLMLMPEAKADIYYYNTEITHSPWPAGRLSTS